MYSQESIKTLKKVYQNALTKPKIALFLGAGVTIPSDIPNYSKFALEAFISAYDQNKLSVNIDKKILSYIGEQNKLCDKQRSIKPEEVFLLIRKYFKRDNQSDDEWRREWLNFCAHELYRRNNTLKMGKWRIKEDAYITNATLNALIDFCVIKSAPGRFKHGIGINPRVGGIITTNYDSLFEAGFNHKYTKSKGTEYGMRPLMEGTRKVNTTNSLPVAHIHGYLTFNLEKNGYQNKKKYENELSGIVVSEADYFKTFYESMSFSNYTAMTYLDNYHTIFIGSKMEDKNIRRFLYHLKQSSKKGTEKFAIMSCKCKTHKKENSEYGTFKPSCLENSYVFTQEVLDVYDVKVIWLCNHHQIPGLFNDIYTSTENDTVVMNGTLRNTNK